MKKFSDIGRSEQKRFDKIRTWALGDVGKPRLAGAAYRVMVAKRALEAGYEDMDDCGAVVVDALADLMHLCGHVGMEFEDLLRVAEEHYTREGGGGPCSC